MNETTQAADLARNVKAAVTSSASDCTGLDVATSLVALADAVLHLADALALALVAPAATTTPAN